MFILELQMLSDLNSSCKKKQYQEANFSHDLLSFIQLNTFQSIYFIILSLFSYYILDQIIINNQFIYIYKFWRMQIQASQILEQQVKAYNVFQHQKPNHFYLKTFNKQFNEFLEGGLHTGMITQIYGQSGGGKTQMAMIFSISAIYSNSIVGYLATQKQLHWGRFTQLAYNFMNEAEFDQKQVLFKYKKCLDSFDVQINFIEQIFREIEKSKKGGLLVIDNIYALINSSFAYFKIQSAYQKTRKQAEIINKIRKLAKITNSCVLLINKVSDVIQKKRKSLGGRQTAPSLGASWQLNVDESFEIKKGQRSNIKQLIVIHSPKCKQGKILLRIQQKGFVFINQEGIQYQ